MTNAPKMPAISGPLVTPPTRLGALPAPRERRLSVHRIVVWFAPFSISAADLDMSDCDIEGDLNYGRD